MTSSFLLNKAKGDERSLTGDSTASDDTDQAIADGRIQRIICLQDPDVVTDLRHLNEGTKERYQVFWEYCKKFIEQRVKTAVHDHRHRHVTHLSCVIRVRLLVEQVKAMCPAGTPIPSTQWVRLQFWPKNPTAKQAFNTQEKWNVKFVVQACQTRMWHEDARYASAVYRYLKEMAVNCRDIRDLVLMDDKQKCKVGEPILVQWQLSREERLWWLGWMERSSVLLIMTL